MSEHTFSRLLSADVQAFIAKKIHTNTTDLLLRKSPFPDVSVADLAQQIKGRQVAARKFPFLLVPNAIFPPGLSLEQASSEATARYKATLTSGLSFLDLTAGFGIDAYFMSKNFQETTLVEKNPELVEILRHNWAELARDAVFFCRNIADFLSQNKREFDLVYLDPARRNADQRKVFLLEDLSPNILEIRQRLLEISPKILIKLSPLIDISYLVSAVKNLAEIHIVALKNDVKEVLLLLERDISRSEINIKCINLESGEPDFSFGFNEEQSATPSFSAPLNFLYIPNNAVLKSGAFRLLGRRFGIRRLHPNTQLYTSESPISDFPGRMLEVEIMNAKKLQKGERFHVISKNYPLSPEQIRKKYRISDGGTSYLIFTESVEGKVVLRSK